MDELVLSLKELCFFLDIAKKSTYAKDAPRSASKSVLSKNYSFEKGNFRYEDQYFGEYVDVGEEIVWFKELPIWGMGYRGGIHRKFSSEKESTFNALRKALCMPESNFPIRGPRYIQLGKYHYYNYPTGNISSFTGHEIILRDSQEICYRHYVGGLIYGKHNLSMIVTE